LLLTLIGICKNPLGVDPCFFFMGRATFSGEVVGHKQTVCQQLLFFLLDTLFFLTILAILGCKIEVAYLLLFSLTTGAGRVATDLDIRRAMVGEKGGPMPWEDEDIRMILSMGVKDRFRIVLQAKELLEGFDKILR
jgi:hypothetical protein